jgi:uncharacterized protein YjbK
MKQNVEIDYKLLINETQYNGLVANFPGETFSQTNFYFDNQDHQLKKRSISCRIRTYLDEVELTFKIPRKKGKDEVTFEHVDPETAFTRSDVAFFMARMGIISPLIHQGTLETIRSTFKLRYGLLCIDKNTYNGITDYEVEYEVYRNLKKGLSEFREILAFFGLSYIKDCDSKIKRCLSTAPQDSI